jgi:ribosome-associated translation inhibitor RaiA
MEQELWEPTIIVRGAVPDQLVAYAREKIRGIAEHAAVPVLGMELRLDHHADPARDRPHHVEMTIDLDGTPVRAHRSARTMTEAVDRTAARLRRRVEDANERPQDRQLRHRDESSWHHDDRPSERPMVYPRPVEERELVRRKTFALAPEGIEEALFDLETLDHDFFLFVHSETDAEAVVYRTVDGYGLSQRVPTPDAIERVGIPIEVGPQPAERKLQDALALLDETEAPFEFFVDAETDRGVVVYRRYDGHYGCILPS